MTTKESHTGKSSPAYYFYENWVAHGHTAKIHYSHCGFCNSGRGIHQTDSTRCGQWQGPFDSLNEATLAAKDTGATVTKCRKCRPQASPPTQTPPPYSPHTIETGPPVRAMSDPTRSFFGAVLARGIISDPTSQSLIRQVREEFDLIEPITDADLEANRKVGMRKVFARLRQLAATAEWTEEIEFLKYLFNPKYIEDELLKLFLESTESLTASQQQLLQAMAAAVAQAVIDSGLQDLFAQVFLGTLARYAIAGDLYQPDGFPPWFSGSVVQLPFWGDTIVLAFASRFADVNKIAREFKRKHKAVSRRRQRYRQPNDSPRDLWVLTRYLELRDLHATDAESDSIYMELLDQFESSPWRKQLDKYELDSPYANFPGALGFLRRIVQRLRARWREILADMPLLPPDTP